MPIKDKELKRIYDQERYMKNVQFIRDYKVKIGCKDCGYSKHHAGLQFDHLPGFIKTRNIAATLSRATKNLQRELEKCEVVCSTCHSIRTFERGQQSNKK